MHLKRIIKIIDRNFNFHAYKIPEETDGMKVIHLPGLSYIDSDLPCDTFNIIHITNGKKISFKNIEYAINYFIDKNLPYCIWVNEENLSENLKTIFSILNIRKQNKEAGMILNIREYKIDNNPLHLNIQIVNTVNQVQEFAEVIAQNWDPPDDNVISYYNKTGRKFMENSSTITFAIYYDQTKPVAVIEMFSTDNVTMGLYSLATLKRYRGKGIGTALLTFALNKAKLMGYQNVVLQASEDGIHIYRKAGFKIETTYYEYACL